MTDIWIAILAELRATLFWHLIGNPYESSITWMIVLTRLDLTASRCSIKSNQSSQQINQVFYPHYHINVSGRYQMCVEFCSSTELALSTKKCAFMINLDSFFGWEPIAVRYKNPSSINILLTFVWEWPTMGMLILSFPKSTFPCHLLQTLREHARKGSYKTKFQPSISRGRTC